MEGQIFLTVNGGQCSLPVMVLLRSFKQLFVRDYQGGKTDVKMDIY